MFSIVLFDADKLSLGFTYRYSTEEDVYIIELGLLFMYFSLALKKKRVNNSLFYYLLLVLNLIPQSFLKSSSKIALI